MQLFPRHSDAHKVMNDFEQIGGSCEEGENAEFTIRCEYCTVKFDCIKDCLGWRLQLRETIFRMDMDLSNKDIGGLEEEVPIEDIKLLILTGAGSTNKSLSKDIAVHRCKRAYEILGPQLERHKRFLKVWSVYPDVILSDEELLI